MLNAETIDHRVVDWSAVRTTSYVIRQRFRYDYDGPVSNLQQRLVIIPRPRHGDQQLVAYDVRVSGATVERRQSVDEFGNVVLELATPRVERSIDFTAEIAVSRKRRQRPLPVVSRLAVPSPWEVLSRLTHPDGALKRAAETLRTPDLTEYELANLINSWVFRQMEYAPGTTNLGTTAAEAFALGRGVCQDFAHVTLALCRLCGLPARYVSGHLLGEGGTHAWVEVLLPDGEREGRWIARAFDPTHERETDFRYLTVAVGRDYIDVAPTSGTYRSPFAGVLSASKIAMITALQTEPLYP